ncbi:MAG: carboxypeptidase regulatory-like domain-containing protein [Terriglobia bacterium]
MHRTPRKEMILVFVCAALLSGWSFTPLWAQIDVGRVSGTVRDPSGAVAPGAQLTLTNQATGVAQTTRSSSTGTYVFVSVPPGVYTLKCEAPGFRTDLEKALVVHVQNTVTADISLVVGSTTQQVAVTAAAPLLQAQDASVGTTIGTADVNDLPLNGRNFLTLARIQPGSYWSNSSSVTPSLQGGSVYANGEESGQVDFRMNGVDNNEEVFGGLTISPVPDAIDEFKFQAGDNSAEFGHSIGAVVNVALKSGANQLHGDLFEYNRNEAYDANDFFSNRNGVARPAYRLNQFGGTVGGPVYIPRVYDGRNKTFFFFDFQRTVGEGPSSFTDTVPTAQMQSSGFTNLQSLITGNSGTVKDGLGRTFPLGTVLDAATTRAVAPGATDPITGLKNTGSSAVYVRDPFYSGSLVGVTNFTGLASQLNMIPVSRIDPNAVKILKLLPMPNQPGLMNDYFADVNSFSYINQWDLRIDHTLSQKDTLFGVFSRFNQTQTASQPFSATLGSALQTNFATTQPTYILSLSETHLFSPTLVNEARYGIDHNYNTREIPTANTLGLPAQYGIQGVPQLAGNGGLPTFNLGQFSAFGGRRFSPTIQTTGADEFDDNVTWVHGAHEFKTGVQYNRIVGHIIQPAYSHGNLSWNGQFSGVPNVSSSYGAVAIADMLLVPTISSVPGGYNNLGGMNGYNGSNYAGTNYNANYFGLYAQDNWKVTPTLTLNLGVRWDYFGPYSESDGRQANFNMNGGNGASGIYVMPISGCAVPRSAGFNSLLAGYSIQIICAPGGSVEEAQKTNFGPHLGFAYRLRPRLVVRGGYSIAYGSFSSVGYGGTLGTNYPFQYTLNNPTTNFNTPVTVNGQTATMENIFSSLNLQDPSGVNGINLGLTGRQYNWQTPYSETINFTVQDQFTNRDSFQIGYVGTLGRHLNVNEAMNVPTEVLPVSVNTTNYRPFPNLSQGNQFLNTDANSNYHSLQVTFDHRFRSGVSIAANYTYAKCMSDGAWNLDSGPRAAWLPGFGIGNDYTVCSNFVNNVVHVYGEYDLPFGSGRAFLNHTNRVVNAVLGGWQFNYLFTYQSGQPFGVGCPSSTSDFGCDAFLVPGQNPYAGPHNETQWLNPSAFAQPPQATAIGQTDFAPLGGRPNQVYGPHLYDLDSSLFKNFTVRESMYFQFRLEAFNTFNTPNFGAPGQLNFTNLKNFSNITGLNTPPRIVQLGLKFYF